MTQKARSTKEKKMDFSKIKMFYSANNTILKMKRQDTDWEKIFAKHPFNKGLVFRIQKTTYNSKTCIYNIENHV